MDDSRSVSRWFDFGAIDRADLADSTKYKYKRELRKYLDAGHKLGDRAALVDWAAGLVKSRRAFLKAAIRLVSQDYEAAIKAGAVPGNIAEVQAAVFRLEALQDAIKVKRSDGKKAHFWLRADEVKRMMGLTYEAPGDLAYMRDRVVLGLMVGAGLRRSEVVGLTFGDVSTVPNGKGDRDVINVCGKGAKDRTVPINLALATYIEDWRQALGAGPDDLIARSLARGVVGDSMSAVAVFHLVRKYGAMIGKPDLAPHDLRRTFAQLGYDAGVPLTQISELLGHSSLDVTRAYLDLSLDLDVTASDFIPL